jgi:hypothetical protein
MLPGIYPYYSYSGYPWLFDEGDDSQPYPNNGQAPPPAYGDQAPPPDYGPAPYPYYAPVPPAAQSQGWPPLSSPYVVIYAPPAVPPTEEKPVTLIFRNGRAPEQIHNYLLTHTTISVLDQPYRQIPLDQIDIAATVEENREAGVDFRVPESSR